MKTRLTAYQDAVYGEVYIARETETSLHSFKVFPETLLSRSKMLEKVGIKKLLELERREPAQIQPDFLHLGCQIDKPHPFLWVSPKGF